MKQFIARLKYHFTGRTDPMNLLNGVFQQNLPNRLTISSGMLKSKDLAYEAGDLVAKLFQNPDDDDFLFAQRLRSIPRHWGTLEALMFYNAMVCNGGHQQYFRNSKGAYRDLVEDGLRLYASDFHLQIFQRALFRYDPVFHSAHADLEASTPPPADSSDLYDDLDGLYFKADPELAKLVEQYIRCNLKLYRG
jgi:hypothetical protein